MKKWQYYLLAGVLVGGLAAIPLTRGAKSEKPSIQQEVSHETITEITTASQLEEIIKNNDKVVVDFGATWCGPCKAYKPVYHEIAEEYNTKGIMFCEVVMDKMDSKEEVKIIDEYKIKYIPKTMLFKQGKEVFNQVGGISKEDLRSYVADFLLK